MTEVRPILQVFLASPGDLVDERRAARDIVDRINHGLARQLGWRIELLGWEDTLPGAGRPQELINRDVMTCDLFVGALHERWGMPTGTHSSGFEEEFELAMGRHSESGVPQIWLFFKEMHPKALEDVGPHAAQVIAFKDREKSLHRVLFKEFETTEEWHALIWQHLTEFLAVRAKTEERESEPSQSEATDSDSGAGSAAPSDNAALEEIRCALVRLGLLLADGSEPFTVSDDLLRAALFSSAATSFRTDDTWATHQNNLTYRRRDAITLAGPEEVFVVRTLLAGGNENTTGWYWFRDTPGEDLLRFVAIRGRMDDDISVRQGAIKLLTDCGALPDGLDLTALVTSVLADRNVAVRRAGLTLLERYVDKFEEWEEVLDELAQSDPEVAASASALRLRLLAKLQPKRAFDELVSSDAREAEAVAQLVANAVTFDDEDMKQALNSQNSALRLLAVRELHRRDLLTPELARGLLGDPSGKVRELVLAQGFEGLGLTDLAAALADLKPEPGEYATDLRDSMTRAVFERLPDSELETIATRWFDIDSSIAYSVLVSRNFRKFGATAVADLADHFQGRRARIKSSMTSEAGEAAVAALETQFAEYESLLTALMIRGALRGLSDHLDRRHRPVVLEYTSFGDLEVRNLAFELLAKIATADDAELFLERALEMAYSDHAVAHAETALRVARRDAVRSLRERLIASEHEALVRVAFEHRVIARERGWLRQRAQSLLYAESLRVRREAVRYLIRELPRERQETLLARYLQTQGRYYYNVITWLDRLLYAPEPLRRAYATWLEISD